MRSQARAFSRQVPLLYFVLIINTLALTSTHRGAAPDYLTIWLPLLLYAGCVFRLVKWWRLRNREMTDEIIVKMLKGTIRFAYFMGGAFTAWSLALYPYGDPYVQSFVPFYMAVTVICIILCLMHVRAAALIITLMVIPAYTLFFGTTGNPVFFAMAINVFLVVCGLMFMLHVNYRDFANLIETQKALETKQIETQRLVDENFRLANIDSLTDLPNRRSFFAAINRLTGGEQNASSHFAIGAIDLDGFKPVNDLYGHATGDRILVEVGRRLMALSTPDVLIARIGGDEFGVILHGKSDPCAVQAFGEKICAALGEPYVVGDLTINISGTAGFAMGTQGAEESSHLMEQADCALYHAKAKNRGCTVMFDAIHEIEMRRHSTIEQALRKANFAAEFTMVFQPIMDINKGRPTGFEALARWNSPLLGKVAPDVFIATAERSGLISRLSEHLLRRTLELACHLPSGCYVSFNLSACDIASQEAIERIASIVRESGIAPSRIEFEITETAVMYDFEQACASLAVLRALGCKAVLDDFGTGYSSLSYIRQLPLDKIKIDRGFVADVETSAASRAILKSVVELCSSLDIECVVEGTEMCAQVTILSRMGVNLFQGYYFARPMPVEDVDHYMQAFSAGGETILSA